jgi:hypothetical protein
MQECNSKSKQTTKAHQMLTKLHINPERSTDLSIKVAARHDETCHRTQISGLGKQSAEMSCDAH